MIAADFPWEQFVKTALERQGTCGPGPSAHLLRVHTGPGPAGPDGEPLFADSWVDLDLASDPAEGVNAVAHVLPQPAAQIVQVYLRDNESKGVEVN